MAKKARKMPAALAAFALAAAMALTGCPASDVAEIKRIAVTFDSNFAAGEGTGSPPPQRAANAGASIELPGRGSLQKYGHIFGGWNTQADGEGASHAAGSGFAANSSATLFAEWAAPEPISIAITGLPAGLTASMTIRNLAGDIMLYERQPANIGGTLFIASTIPGAHYIRLRSRSEGYEWRSISPLKITAAGPNEFALDADFEKSAPIAITVDGIGAAADIAMMRLFDGAGNWLAQSWAELEGDATLAASFDYSDFEDALFSSYRFPAPGAYKIFLALSKACSSMISGHIISSRNIIHGSNAIPFADFAEKPLTRITVAGMQRYEGDSMRATARNLETMEVADGWAQAASGSAPAVFVLWDSDANLPHSASGTYDVALIIFRRTFDPDNSAIISYIPASYTARGIPLAAGQDTEIPWAEFAAD